MSEKITEEHLQRKAIVYVRQSTPEQVRANRESQLRQYELAQLAKALGFKEVEIIDEDLGRSGSGTSDRPGFKRLVAAVCLKEVGAVFSLEASRLARNSRDWHQLVDLCGLMGTLIIDLDGIYDPRLVNDRLLLGLKGTMSEFELNLIRQRALEALRGMARRGELLTTVPIGYVRTPDNRLEKDPDLRVQQVIRLVFDKFAQCGSVRQVLLWLRQEKILFPSVEHGPWGRRISWRFPVYNTVLKVLTNPTYAGAYVWGRTVTLTKVVDGRAMKTRGHRQEQEHWEVLIKDHHEGYISWETYERNQKQIRDNAAMKGAMTRGPVKSGKSLLAGLLRCRRCGRKLHVSYSGSNSDVPRYSCRGAQVNHGADKCLSFGGLAVDRAVEREIIKVVQPAAIEAAFAAKERAWSDNEARREALALALQQARYEAERIGRQYDAVEPENRLVAAELERRWNAALAKVAALERELEKIPASPAHLEANERERLLALAQDFPRVWNDSETDARLKKRIIRTLVEEIVADVDEERALIRLVIHWAGGCHSTLEVKKNRTGHHRYCTEQRVIDLVRELAKVAPDRDIARILNRLELKTGRGNAFTEARVASLRHQQGIPPYSPLRQEEEGWLNMRQAAKLLGISPMSVRRLLQSGVIQGKQVVPFAPWVIQREALEQEGVKAAVLRIKQGGRGPLPENPWQQKLEFPSTL